MVDAEEASLFTKERVLDHHLGTATGTVRGHVQRLNMLAESYLVLKLLCLEDGVIKPIGHTL